MFATSTPDPNARRPVPLISPMSASVPTLVEPLPALATCCSVGVFVYGATTASAMPVAVALVMYPRAIVARSSAFVAAVTLLLLARSPAVTLAVVA